MTPLARRIATQIATTGPLSIADYMAVCLLHPEHGYYTTRQPLGRSGDFVTSPEISQMFGELLGLCLAQAWMDQGAPPRFALVELGPGRGTLLADLLRATAGIPGWAAASEIHLVEASPVLQDQQARIAPDATWHDTVETLPELPTFAIANEFFDALPIRQFVRDGAGWRERQIGLKDGALLFGLSAPLPPETLADRLDDTSDGDVVEICAGAEPVMRHLGARIATHGGAGIVVDYGSARSLGDTFQAVADHKKVDPLEAPGTADLTAHVDFGALARAASPALASALLPQGEFLGRLGIAHRAEALARNLTGERLETHISATRRLTEPHQMGNLFRVLGIVPPNAPLPPGLDPAPDR